MIEKKTSSLFAYFYPLAYKNTYGRFQDWWKDNKLIFLAAFLISIAAHIALIILFYALPSIPPQVHQAVSPADKRESLPQILPSRQASKARIQIESESTRTTASRLPQPPIPAENRVFSTTLSWEKQEELGYVLEQKALRRTFRSEGDRVRVQTRTYELTVPAAYFLRECPYSDLLAAGADLFYIIRDFPDFGGDEIQNLDLADLSFDTRKIFHKQDSPSTDIKTTFPYYRAIHSQLSISESRETEGFIPSGNFSPILDELMPQSEIDQFLQFKRQYLGRYDPNHEQLAALTGAFIHNNANNIIFILTDISTAFDYLEELFYSKFLDYQLYDFWSRNPNSKVGTEIMLALACRYIFERRALQSLFKAYTAAQEFLDEKEFEANIYNKKAKCLVIKEVYEDLNRRLLEKGISSLEEILTTYVREEVKIYHYLIPREQPERNCGLFARGILSWNSGLYEEALKDWKQVDRDFMNNKTWEDISTIISEAKDRQEMISRITTILDVYESEGTEQLLLRLLQFGRWLTRANNLKY